jgi:hypothetical protein
MRTELKKAIIEWIFGNLNTWQITNECINEFRQYIYKENGSYCIGGREVSDFIEKAISLITEE